MSLLNVKTFLASVGFNFVYVYKYFALEHPDAADAVNDMCIDTERQLSRSIKAALKEIDLDALHALAKISKDQKTVMHKAALKALKPAVVLPFPTVDDYRMVAKKVDDLREDRDYSQAENRFLQSDLDVVNKENAALREENRQLKIEIVDLNRVIAKLTKSNHVARDAKWGTSVDDDWLNEDTLTK